MAQISFAHSCLLYASAVFLLCFQIAEVAALSVHGLKTLVVYDKRVTDLEDYSKFFNDLNKRSYELQFSSVNENVSDIQLFRGEERLFDNLIVFPVKSRQVSKGFTAATLLKFFEEGGDILTVTSPYGLTESVRTFLNQLGIFPSPRNHELRDYFEEGNTTSIHFSSSGTLNPTVFSPMKSANLSYEGSAALLDNRDLLIPIFSAPRTSFTKDPKGGDDWTVGLQGYTVVGFQNLHNARVSWVGSDKFFGNSHYNDNGEFVQELAKWTFREKAVIKSTGFKHKHIDGTSYDELPYKVKDSITYEIGFSEWNGKTWIPFNASDIQFELKMIDPYYRLKLLPVRKSEEAQYYSTGNFMLPDHHGVFTFLTEYQRSGLSFVTEKDVKSIRHLANDEYPRSWDITNSWVYLTSICSVIMAWILFVILYISSSSAMNVPAEKKIN
ncbi:LAFE_0G11056g1_1 [Lachancea fermentati]|uniref:Dolichyl-diphosphooligosaccharide--protein glycosyltransferase subunit WBP1 n=1 Tax=Lachancea fermentati TaxID=4955 RepID=A0A1G4MHS1_LACFM|nr:LAFE_0G11056g1_1 [Lachancea fermentati]